MKSLLKPKLLKAGARLGVVACSNPISGTTDETIDRGYGVLRSLGFEVIEAPNCRKTFGHSAGTIRERADTINSFFSDPSIDGIINFWGGFQSHQLLEFLDFDLITKNPKPFIGYSDTTALHVGLHSQTGLVPFLGPAVITFAKPQVPEFTMEYFKKMLMAPQPSVQLRPSETYSENKWYLEPEKTMRFSPNSGWKVFRPGQAVGPIMGGNLGTMLLLAGTKYWPDLNGRILFVEEDEVENSRTLDRMFFQLRHMGVYNQISGMVVGRFHSDVGFNSSDSLEMILDAALEGYGFPVVTDVDFGHTDPLLTIPLGISCEINTDPLAINFLERAVEA